MDGFNRKFNIKSGLFPAFVWRDSIFIGWRGRKGGIANRTHPSTRAYIILQRRQKQHITHRPITIRPSNSRVSHIEHSPFCVVFQFAFSLHFAFETRTNENKSKIGWILNYSWPIGFSANNDWACCPNDCIAFLFLATSLFLFFSSFVLLIWMAEFILSCLLSIECTVD